MNHELEFILPPSGEWVGPPALFLKLHGKEPVLIDGSRRLAEIRARNLKTIVPMLNATSHLEVIKHLTLANEYAKAAFHINRYYPELKERGAAGIAGLLGLKQQRLIPVVSALREPSERHKLPRRAIGVVKRLKRLKERLANGERFHLSMVDEVLGEFKE